jgi:hypothetical protein
MNVMPDEIGGKTGMISGNYIRIFLNYAKNRPVRSQSLITPIFSNIFNSFSHADILHDRIVIIPHGLAESMAVTGENSPLECISG